MAGAACKVIINMGVKALTEAVEKILTDPNIHQNIIPDKVRLDLIQDLADTDLMAYLGDNYTPSNGVSGVLIELQRYGLITDEVWEIYNKPVSGGIKKGDKK